MHFNEQVQQLKKDCFPNQHQLEVVMAAKQYIDQHYSQELDLDSLAKHHCLSKYHLIRLFRRYYGQTPRQILISCRIAKARDLLLEGQSVTDTCYAVGFESVSSFSSLFKRRTGQNPSAFKERQFSITKSKQE